jgi:hypothetical protein
LLTRLSASRVSCLFTVCAVILVAADPPWKTKPAASWSAEDASQILADSPWAKPIKALISALQTEDQRREGGQMGQPHGIGFDGIADDRPRIKAPTSLIDIVKPESPTAQESQTLTLLVRWESALPIRVAELKSRFVDAPTLPDEGYSVAVYGIPTAKVKGDSKTLGDPLRKYAVLKREGKKDVRPSTVDVFQRDDGLVILYQFPPSAEITPNDRRIEFNAQIGRIFIVQSFDVEDMRFQGKLEL